MTDEELIRLNLLLLQYAVEFTSKTVWMTWSEVLDEMKKRGIEYKDML